MPTLRILGGKIYDPANGVDGEVRDVWISDGIVIEPPNDPDTRAARTIDARGYVVMPGGVDVHCHIAGPKVNAARSMRPEDGRDSDPDAIVRRFDRFRSGTLGSVPSTFATGYRYAGLGYTTAVDAAVPAFGARHVHAELADTPIIDAAFLVLLGDDHFVLDRVADGNDALLRDYVAWTLEAIRGYGVKVVNPGGIERWKQGQPRIGTLDDRVEPFGVTPRAILTSLARAVDTLSLPHPIHVHGLNLGLPGSAGTMAETMVALDGHRAHLAHVQFHSYGGDPDDQKTFRSEVANLAEAFNAHAHLTADVGQVMFGETTSMTADGAVGHYLARLTGRKWINHDVELETGCGVVPITYSDTNFVHALQFAIGLEWFLRVDDPWRIALSTDHPNGGSFLAYPQIIALLMDRGHRADVLARLPKRARNRTGLGEIAREYTLGEIAIITRAAPARMLGMTHKGHLGPGADGDVAIYAPDDDRRRMFALPRWVVKAGEIVIDDGELRAAGDGFVLHAMANYDTAVVTAAHDWMEREMTIRPGNFAIRPEEIQRAKAISAS